MVELSGIEVIPLIREIGDLLSLTYVNNVFSVGDNQVVRFRHPTETDRWLVLSPRRGAWMSEKVAERTETTEFTSKLRSEVERLRFVGASQVDLDRVFEFQLGEEGRMRHLILEMMPPGNIIVTDALGKVLVALRESKGGRRRLRRGEKYSPPPQSRISPREASAESLRGALLKEETLGGALGRQVALPRKYVREVLERVGLSESDRAKDALAKANEIAAAIEGIVGEATSAPRPCLAKTTEGEEIFAVIPKSLEVVKQASTMSALCDEIFAGPLLQEIKEEPTQEDRWRKEMEVTVSRLRGQERELTERAGNLRRAAEQARGSKGLGEAMEILVRENPSSRKTTHPKSVEAIVSALFSLAKEADTKAIEARTAAATLSRRRPPAGTAGRKQLSKLTSRKGEWYEKFRWFITTAGKLAIGGRDAQSNTLLVRRHLENEDTVYHADVFGSPFFVLKRGTEQTPEEVLEVAQATVAFSSAWKTGLGTADAYWVNKEQVGTSAPSGEYLAKGSFMIRGKKNTIPHNLVQVAVGLDQMGRIVAGPEGAVASSCERYVVLVPHREKASETAKKVAHELRRMEGEGEGPSVDDVLRALPAGGGKIVRSKAARSEDKPK